MKKLEFQTIVKTLIEGDIIILHIRPLQFMPFRANNFPPLAHCIFIKADREFIEVSFEGTLNEGGELATGDKLPNRVNYARIEKIEKI